MKNDELKNVFVDGSRILDEIEDIEPAFPGPTYDGSASFLKKVPKSFHVITPPLVETPLPSILDSVPKEEVTLEQNGYYLVKKNTEFDEFEEIYEVKVKQFSISKDFVKLARFADTTREEVSWYRVSNLEVLDRLY